MPARPFPLDRTADVGGLTAAAAALRRARFGPNDVLEPRRHPWWTLVADTARDPMLWFLLGTSTLYAVLGDRLEAATLAAAIVPLALMDAFLHRRTAVSIAGLKSRLAAHALVRRDGREREVPAVEVVPGDRVIVPAGTPVPADGVLIGGADVQVDESALTGESVPVRKRVLPSWPPRGRGTPAIGGEHWLSAGTRVLAGRAEVTVAYTGAETTYGEIVRVAAAGESARTPLQHAIAGLVLTLTVAAAGACLTLGLVRLWQGHGWTDALVSALTLAVAALPEELPVAFTFFLGVGVHRLARRRALVRRAAAVENVGRVTTICSDKTGTLTEGRLELTHVVPAPGLDDRGVVALAVAAARPEDGDPLDVALAAAAGSEAAAAARVACFPFTEERKRETAVVRRPDGTLVAVVKGAVETLLGLAAPGGEAARWTTEAETLAAGGHKVIACASVVLPPTWDGREPSGALAFAGLLAFEDPVRPGVAAAIARCRAADLRVVVVTGDHPLTALAVARELGLGGEAPVVATGDEIAAALATGPAELVSAVDVVARATPAQKLALVRGLQAAGELVAVTGDGVNDVPALKTADVGIAMGERGTQSAREAAPIVLLDDDFATIAGAIAEGRQLFHNLKRSIQYLLMLHLPLVATAALIPLAGYPLLYLPIHIVWLELVMHPTALLGFQAPAAATPRPRPTATRLLSADEWLAVGVVGTALTLLVAGGFLGALAGGNGVEHARGIALLVLSVASAAIAAVQTGLATAAARVVTALTVVGALVLVQTPALAARLHVRPLHVGEVAGAMAAGALVAGLATVLARAAARRLEAAA